MSNILSFFLALSVLLGGLAGGAEPAPSGVTLSGEAAAAFAARSQRESSHLTDRSRLGEPSYGDMTYVHYDPASFYHDAELMADRAAEGDGPGACELYDKLYDEFVYIDSLSTLAMIRYDQDYTDDYWSGEYTYMNNLWAETQDALLTACAEALDSPAGDAFAAHIGREAAALCYGYDAATAEDLENTARELELEDQYRALYDGLEELAFSYEGRNWTLNDLYGFRGDALYYRDPDAYYAVLDGIHQRMAEEFAPVYIELVSLWTEEARSAGYENYVDYAYEAVFARDYTPEDAQRFCDAVKPLARAYYEDLYYSDVYFDADQVKPALDGDELIAALGTYLPRIDQRLTEPWTAMTERGLYDIGSNAPGRYDGCYTTTLLSWHAPFLFVTLQDSCEDLISVTHEFGHFCDYWFNPMENLLTQTDNLDLSEIHSNALQALFTAYYGEIFDRGGEIAEFINLADLLENIFDGCLYDEFQRRVLSEPEGLTPERINEIHCELCAEYGLYEPGDMVWDSGWVQIPHTFEYPLYYISYAVSAMAALQIWDLAQTDRDAAVDVYLDVLSRGSFGDGYLAVLKSVGLRLFTEADAPEAVCRPVLDRLEAIDRAYS